MGGFDWGGRVLAYRKARGWNQTGFAHAAGITQCKVSLIERGLVPKRETIMKIIRIQEFHRDFCLYLLEKYMDNTYK